MGPLPTKLGTVSAERHAFSRELFASHGGTREEDEGDGEEVVDGEAVGLQLGSQRAGARVLARQSFTISSITSKMKLLMIAFVDFF